MKKTLLALATASTVAIAGTSVAAAEAADTPQNPSTEGSSQLFGGSSEGKTTNETSEADSEDKDPAEGKDSSSSSGKFFDWNESTKVPTKIKDIATLVGAVVTLVGGVAALITNFQKLGNLFKK